MAYQEFRNGFKVQTGSAIDKRLLLSKAEMLTVEEDYTMPDEYFAVCKDDGKVYLYKASNTVDAETGKFRVIDDTLDKTNALINASTAAISTEETRAKAAEDLLNTAISNEVTAARSAESDLQTAITNEATTARAAESANATAIANEATRAQAAEAANAGAVTTETNRAEAAEAGLQTAINNFVKANPEISGDEDNLTSIEVNGTKYKVTGNSVEINKEDLIVEDYASAILGPDTITTSNGTVLNNPVVYLLNNYGGNNTERLSFKDPNDPDFDESFLLDDLGSSDWIAKNILNYSEDQTGIGIDTRCRFVFYDTDAETGGTIRFNETPYSILAKTGGNTFITEDPEETGFRFEIGIGADPETGNSRVFCELVEIPKEVIANPTLVGDEEDLTGLEVNGTKYKITGSSSATGSIGTNDFTKVVTYANLGNDSFSGQTLGIADTLPADYPEQVQVASIGAVIDSVATWDSFEPEPIPYTAGYLELSGNRQFELTLDREPNPWDGTVEYSTDLENWRIWNLRTSEYTTISSSEDGKLYLRGTGNTKITGLQGDYRFFEITNDVEISISGCFEALLDYNKLMHNFHPDMDAFCFASMFSRVSQIVYIDPDVFASRDTLTFGCYAYMFAGCSSLTIAPRLPAMSLARSCYKEMFRNCSALTAIPALPATNLIIDCYDNLFIESTSIHISDVQTAEYPNIYRVPFGNLRVESHDSGLEWMFDGTGGPITEIEVNKVYYTSNTVIS